jgi:hypothetical protein
MALLRTPLAVASSRSLLPLPEQVWAPALQHLPAFDETQPERAVSRISRCCGKASALIGATLEFVMAPGSGSSESERQFFDSGMFDGGVEHTGSFCNGERLLMLPFDHCWIEQNKNNRQA